MLWSEYYRKAIGYRVAIENQRISQTYPRNSITVK